MTAPRPITDSQIQSAEGIYTLDPQDPQAAGHHLWGVRSEPSSQPQAAAERNLLEIALPSDDHVALLALIDRVERIKGSLPEDVRVLRKNLRG